MSGDHADKTKRKIEHDFAAASIAVVEPEWLLEEEAAVSRKFDSTITPLVTVMYMLCAIDR